MTEESNRALVATETTTEPETEELSMVPLNTAQRRPDNLSRDLLYPRDSLNPDVDLQLFGSYIDSLGFDKDEIQLSDIQYRFVMKMFEALGDAIKEGRLEEIRPTLRYFMQDIGNRLVAVLARGSQYYEEKAKKEYQSASTWEKIFTYLTDKHTNKEVQKCMYLTSELGSIIEDIEKKRDDLRAKLMLVIQNEEELDSLTNIEQQLKNLVNTIKFNKNFPENLGKQGYPQICTQIASLTDVIQDYPDHKLKTLIEKTIIDVFIMGLSEGNLDQKREKILSQSSFYYNNLGTNTQELHKITGTINALIYNLQIILGNIDKQISRYTRERLGDILSNEDR